MNKKDVLVLGGCGFIGSHLCDKIISRGNNAYIADMSTDNNISSKVQDVYQCDLTSENAVMNILKSVQPDLIYHLAANSNVRSDGVGVNQFNHNTKITSNIVKYAHMFGYPDILFTSSSTVYGQTTEMPVKENSLLNPSSYYGAGKVGSESILQTYQNQTKGTVKIFRLANIIGPGLRNAVIPDFIEKLSRNPDKLEILGDGKQMKSYMHIDDCVDSILYVARESDKTIVNIGTDSTTTVNKIADIVSEVMGLDPKYDYTGGEKGWTGDVPKIKMDVSRMKSLGYEPSMSSDEAVKQATEQLLDEI